METDVQQGIAERGYRAYRIIGEPIRQWFQRLDGELDHARAHGADKDTITRLDRARDDALEAVRAQD